MDGIAVEMDTTGLDELARIFDNDVDAILHAAAAQVIALATVAAPYETGALKNSLHVRPRAAPGVAIMSDGVEYGIYQELGTHIMAAQPFFIPAFMRVADELVSVKIPSKINEVGK